MPFKGGKNAYAFVATSHSLIVLSPDPVRRVSHHQTKRSTELTVPVMPSKGGDIVALRQRPKDLIVLSSDPDASRSDVRRKGH